MDDIDDIVNSICTAYLYVFIMYFVCNIIKKKCFVCVNEETTACVLCPTTVTC